MKNITVALRELTAKYLSKEILAGKMGVSTRTIERWQENKTKPSYAEKKLLKQIYGGYVNVAKRTKKVLK